MLKSLFSFLSFITILLAPSFVLAQTSQPDTAFVNQAIDGAVQSYRDGVGSHAHLYNGPEYFVPLKAYIKGHQFFQEKSYQKGAVLYDGSWFYDVPMAYDVVKDEVIITHAASGYSQLLVKPRVQLFKLSDHTFIHLNADSVTNTPLKAGYYDLLYNGDVKVLAHRKKELQEQVTPQGMEGQYEIVDVFYLLKDGQYHEVDSKRSVLKVLQDEKKRLNKFARTEGLNFRKQREIAVTKIVGYYDTLEPQEL